MSHTTLVSLPSQAVSGLPPEGAPATIGARAVTTSAPDLVQMDLGREMLGVRRYGALDQ